MDRREFLKSTGVAAAAAATAGAATAREAAHDGDPHAAGVTHLRLSMPWADDGKGFGDSARRLARRIEAATAGRYRISLLESAKSGIDAVAAGEAELYHATEHHHVGHHPAFAHFAGLPAIDSLTAADLDSWLIAGNGQALWDDLAAGFGVKALLAGHTGPVSLWSKTPLMSLSDIAGRKIQMMGLAASAVRGLGAEPAAVPAASLKDALASGELLAAEHGGLIAAMSAGLPEAAPMAYAAPLNSHGTAMSLGVAKPIWDKLSDADKAAFTAAAREEWQVTIAEARGHREPISMALKARFGAASAELGHELHDAMARVGSAVVAHAAGHDALSARINMSYMSFLASAAIA